MAPDTPRYTQIRPDTPSVPPGPPHMICYCSLCMVPFDFEWLSAYMLVAANKKLFSVRELNPISYRQAFHLEYYKV